MQYASLEGELPISGNSHRHVVMMHSFLSSGGEHDSQSSVSQFDVHI